MTYKPVPPIEIFAECLAVPPVLHTSAMGDRNFLTIGTFALPLAMLALRYPTTHDIRLVGIELEKIPRDKRAGAIRDLQGLPADWKADAAALALPGDPTPKISSVTKFLDPQGVLVVAVDQFQDAKTVKDALRQHFPHVLPYIEHAPDKTCFLLASNKKLHKPLRPWPTNLRHLNPRYLQSLFALPVNDYHFLYGPTGA